MGSGRFVRYGTGSDVSMVSVVMRRPALADSVFNCGAAVSPAAQTARHGELRTRPARPSNELSFYCLTSSDALSPFLTSFTLTSESGSLTSCMITIPCGVMLRIVPSDSRSLTCAGNVLPSGALHERDIRAAALEHACDSHFCGREPAEPSARLPVDSGCMPRDTRLTNGSRRPSGL